MDYCSTFLGYIPGEYMFTLQVKSDRERRRPFLELKFMISGFFWVDYFDW